MSSWLQSVQILDGLDQSTLSDYPAVICRALFAKPIRSTAQRLRFHATPVQKLFPWKSRSVT